MGSVYRISLSRKKLIALTASLTFLITGTAFGLSVGNNPDTGYLLCSNVKTHAVIYPAKPSCPSGYLNLALGARGSDGQDGAQGLPGESTQWFWNIQPKDIVGSSSTTFAGLKKVILADIPPTKLSAKGWFQLRANLSGLWSTSTPSNSYIQCYFQSASNYLSGANYGTADTNYTNWTGIYLTVWGDTNDYSLSQSDYYLVCATNGIITGLGGQIHVTSEANFTGLNLGTPPSS